MGGRLRDTLTLNELLKTKGSDEVVMSVRESQTPSGRHWVQKEMQIQQTRLSQSAPGSTDDGALPV